MNPDDRHEPLTPARAEWVPSSPDEIELRVFGTWHGPTVPPRPTLVLGTASVSALSIPPGDDVPPAWSAAFRLPVELRGDAEAGAGVLLLGASVVGVPPAVPGRVEEREPVVLAEHRWRRAAVAEPPADPEPAPDEASTLRTQLAHLEERLARAAEERDALASRVVDAERRLRLAEQREEAERRRRGELEEELAVERREVEDELHTLEERLSSAEEVTEVLERELATARHREEVERTGRLRIDAELTDLRRRLRLTESAVAHGAEAVAEREALRGRVAELEVEVASLRSQLAAPPEPDPAVVEALQAEIENLRARLAADGDAVALREELAREREAHAASEEARRRAAERTREERAAREEAERRLAAGDGPSDAALAGQVAELEAELERRAEIHVRVQGAIDAIRDDLVRVREQVDARRAPEVEALSARSRELELQLAARDQELVSVRAALEEAERAADDSAFAARVQELTAEVAEMRRRLHETTTDLEARLADERARREAAEARLAAPAPEPEGPEDALDALLTGIRAQVESAREQLGDWTPPEPGAPAERPALAPPDAATRARLEAIEADIRAAVPQPDAPAETRDIIASLQEAADRLRSAAEDELARIDDAADEPADAAPAEAAPAEPAESAPAAPAAAAPTEAADAAPAAPAAAVTPAIEVRALPAEPAEPPAPDLATPAAEVVDVRIDVGRREPPQRPSEPAAEPVVLGPRAVDFAARETPWLRAALDRLAESDPAAAADLFLALLPAQAMLDQQLTYLLTAPALGAVRVSIQPGHASLERTLPALVADARISGSLPALAPLVAGGASWRLKGIRVEGSRRAVRRLLWARRRPVTLEDVALMQPPPAPNVLLSALAASIDPAWTAGERFGVAYDIAGEGRWTVIVADGAPLRVVRGGGDQDHQAVIALSADAVLPLLQGAPSTTANPATLTGDARVAETLHGWFDRARGVTTA